MPSTTHHLVTAYHDQLPEGITSHPHCSASSVLVNRIYSDEPRIISFCQHPQFPLPPVQPIPERGFLPLTMQVSAVLALAEIRHWDSQQAKATLRHYGAEILATTFYRSLFYVLTPMLIVLGMGSRYSKEFRGVTASAKMVTKTSARMQLQYPENLYPAFYVEAYNGIFEAALTASGAKNVVSEMEQHTPNEATCLFSWS